VGSLEHPYRKRRPRALDDLDRWRADLRASSVRHSLWMALVVLLLGLGYPGLVKVWFDPTGPGSHTLAVEVFTMGSIGVTLFFVCAALVSWSRR
jgi:hypothetical protein